MNKIIFSLVLILLSVSCSIKKTAYSNREVNKEDIYQVSQLQENMQEPMPDFAGMEKRKFPAIELNKMYAWRNYFNQKLAGYGYYVFTKEDKNNYSGVQINMYWDTNWNITAKATKKKLQIQTPAPWSESWTSNGFDGKTIYGSYTLNGDIYTFEFDVIDTKKNDRLIQNNVKP